MPLDVPGCTRATMIIAVSVLKSSCANNNKYIFLHCNVFFFFFFIKKKERYYGVKFLFIVIFA